MDSAPGWPIELGFGLLGALGDGRKAIERYPGLLMDLLGVSRDSVCCELLADELELSLI